MAERPEYRVLVEGQRHFDCTPLRATLATVACAGRWQGAATGSACANCPTGRQHHEDHHPEAVPSVRAEARWRASSQPCVRCGRTGRLISGLLCLSCYNRNREKILGRNAKGTLPVKLRLQEAEIGILHTDGRIERKLMQVVDMAEALAGVLRNLPDGARVLAGERRLTAWNATTKEFEHVCGRCGTQGLILERVRHGDVLERHAWCCGGEPRGGSWTQAKVRQLLMSAHVDFVAGWLSTDADQVDVEPCAWTPTGYLCSCGAGQIEAQPAEAGGRWRARCGSCGAGGS